MLVFGGKSSPARITYALPDPAVFNKFYNRDILFKDVDWTDWNAVIDGFQKRYELWYFDHLVGGDASYVDFSSLCALVEVFTHYSVEKNWHDESQYKEFLRRAASIFRRKLSQPITITRFSRGRWITGQLKDYADVFYAGVRCSLHHHGDLAAYAGMSGTGQVAIEKPNAGSSQCGRYKYPLVIFDPGKIREVLQDWLKKYCAELKANPASPSAMDFRKKFLNDFGMSVS